MNLYPNGVGGTLGDIFATCKPLMVDSAASVWYVAGIDGTDVAITGGLNREKPLATLEQAVTNSSPGDIIVLLASCSLVLATVVSLGNRMLIGEGSLVGTPTATLGFDGATGALHLDAAGAQVRGIKFTGRTGALAVARVTISASQCSFVDNTMDCGEFDTATALLLSGALTGTRIANSTFASSATDVNAQPESAIKTSGALTDACLESVTVDAGPCGFSNFYAIDFSVGAHVRLRAPSLSLLRGADMTVNSGATYSINPQTTTGGSRVVA